MKIQLIINRAGNDAQNGRLEKYLTHQFGGALVGLETTSDFQEVTDIARRASRSCSSTTGGACADTIVVAGGDGTVNAALNGIVGTDAALGIIPTGLANDLASLYRIPSNLGKACDVILSRRLRRADLITVNGWYYVTAGGFGVGYEIADMVNRVRHNQAGRTAGRILKSKFYLLAALYVLLKNGAASKTLDIEYNGSSFTIDAFMLTVANQPFLGKHFLMTPEAINDDGLFDVCLIKNPRSLARIIPGIRKVLTGRHVKSPYVKMWRTSELIVRAATPLNFFGDGEPYRGSSELRIGIALESLNVIAAR